MKKVLSLVLAVAVIATLCIALVACGETDNQAQKVSFEPIAKANIKLGLITLHGEESTYDKNFIDACKEACTAMGIAAPIVRSGVKESNECYTTAANLVEQGCNIIFADSFGHEAYLLKAAKEFPNVRFAHATGTNAHTELQANFYNAFASIYEGRYLAGVAAGMKMQEMIDAGQFTADQAKMGYVGAFTYAEVISGLTSFYLGAKSVCPTVKMDVRFTGSWYDIDMENQAATALINDGCKLISQHADSMGAPNACNPATGTKIPNVTYNLSTKEACPDSYLCGSRINWVPYFKYLIECTINGVSAIDFDWCGGLEEGSVEVLELGNIAAPGTAEAIATARAELIAGTRKVFDVSKFTVTKDGTSAPLTAYIADVDTDDAFTPDTQVIVTEKGITFFNESAYRSAPYFDITIDGITFKNTAF